MVVNPFEDSALSKIPRFPVRDLLRLTPRHENALLPVAFLVAFLLSMQHICAANDVTVSTAATIGRTFGGGNPNVFTPTVGTAVVNDGEIQTRLNARTGVTLNTASAATGNGDLQIEAPIGKTLGTSSTTHARRRNKCQRQPLPLVLNARGTSTRRGREKDRHP